MYKFGKLVENPPGLSGAGFVTGKHKHLSTQTALYRWCTGLILARA